MRRYPGLVWLTVVLGLGIPGCGRAPQIGGDKDSFKAVDALYTAVSLRDPAALDRCAADLRGLTDGHKLPDHAARALEAIVVEARGGGWESAQARLAVFMRRQRR